MCDQGLFETILFFLFASEEQKKLLLQTVSLDEDEKKKLDIALAEILFLSSLASLVIEFIANGVYTDSSSWMGILFAVVLFIVGFTVAVFGLIVFYKATEGLKRFFAVVPIVLFGLGIWFAT